MPNLPYTQEAILNYLKVMLPDEGYLLEDWVKSKFKEYEYNHRKLPTTITIKTVRSDWLRKYKNRGNERMPAHNRLDRTPPPCNGRIIRSTRGFGG